MRRPALLVAWMMGLVFLTPIAMDSLLGFPLLWLLTTRSDLKLRSATLFSDYLFCCTTALVLLMGLSAFWSPDPTWQELVQVWLRILLVFCFLFAVAESLVEQPGFETVLIRLVVLGALVSAVISIGIFWMDPPRHGRMPGLFRFNNAGKAAHIYSAALPFIAAALWLDRGPWRAAAGAALIVVVAAVALTGTRAAWAGAPLGLAAYILATWQHQPARYTGILTALCAVAAVLFLVALNQPNQDIVAVLLPRGDSHRLEIWSAHWEEIQTIKPFFGQGVLVEQALMFSEKESFRGSHNLFLAITKQIGLIGLFLFVSVVIWSCVRLVRHLHIPVARLGLSLLLLGLVISIFNGDRLVDKLGFVWFVFWFPVAVALAVKRMEASPVADPLA